GPDAVGRHGGGHVDRVAELGDHFAVGAADLDLVRGVEREVGGVEPGRVNSEGVLDAHAQDRVGVGRGDEDAVDDEELTRDAGVGDADGVGVAVDGQGHGDSVDVALDLGAV